MRWAFACIAASAISATLFLLFQLKLAMPLSFASTLLLCLLVAVGLPLLIIALLGKQLSRLRMGFGGQYVLLCMLLSAAFAVAVLS
jgi:hypothetical protein